MAEKMENYEFGGAGGPRPKYPWDEWLDGGTWRITRGADFDVKVASMRKAVFLAAQKHGLRIETRLEGDSLIFRATPKNEDA